MHWIYDFVKLILYSSLYIDLSIAMHWTCVNVYSDYYFYWKNSLG